MFWQAVLFIIYDIYVGECLVFECSLVVVSLYDY